jgi:hypothetical protein
MKPVPTRHIFHIFLCVFALVIFATPKAANACTLPVGVEGEVVYNSSQNILQYCNGSNWLGLVGGRPIITDCPIVGNVCNDGSVFAGLDRNTGERIFTTPADETGTFSWNDGTSNWDDTTMENCTPALTEASCDTGTANTNFLVSLGITTSPAPYEAARHCDGLTAHTHSNWYLPSINELDVLYTNRLAINGFDLTGDFPSGRYLSSSERSDNHSWIQNFDGGGQSSSQKRNPASLRCVRKNIVANPCTETGAIQYNSSSRVPQFCNGTEWTSMAAQPGGGGGSGCFNPPGTQSQMLYNISHRVMQYCDGDKWVALGQLAAIPGAEPTGCPNIGDVCDDGSVNAGTSLDGGTTIYTTPADESGVFTWDDGLGLDFDTAMANCDTAEASCNTGAANTAFLGTFGTSPSPAPHVAALWCANLTAHGYSDWYLPARSELNELYLNRLAIGGFKITAMHMSAWYWSSSEDAEDAAWGQHIDNGGQVEQIKGESLSVRCVRKTRPLDTAPEAFNFIDQTGVALASQIVSAPVTITGIDTATAVSITGDGTPEFRIDGGAWVTSGNILASQVLELRLTSNAAFNTLHSATITVGTLTDQWDVTTLLNNCPTTPSNGDEGCIMPDGSIYAGESLDGNVAMFTTPADAVQFTWNDGSANNFDTAMSNCDVTELSCDTGQANTALLVGLGTNPSPAPYEAARHCDALTAHGHSDWYLPARSELNNLFIHRIAIGGFNMTGTGNPARYWSSSERNNGNAWPIRFTDGDPNNGSKSNDLSVRCVR